MKRFVLIVLGSLLFIIPFWAWASEDHHPDNAQVAHLLDRITFGPAPGDVERVQNMGIERYLQSQLNPNTIPESPDVLQRLSQFQTLSMLPQDLQRQFMSNEIAMAKAQGLSPMEIEEKRKEARKRSRIILQEATEARLIRDIESPRQLESVMTDFWYNHFNIYGAKGLDMLWAGSFENQAIRPYALGHFRDLLGATAHHPAMLFYLDNWQSSVASDRPKAKKTQGLNENYARELMELHTLGVDGGYTQDDVIALAKILTGWGFCGPKRESPNRFDFCFNPRRHDTSDKLFLRHVILGSGYQEGEDALDILAKSPATAHHLSYQLAQYFVTDDPPESLVKKLASKYLETDGDIREVLNTLFHSSEFWDPRYDQSKFKTPYEYVVSSIRATGFPVYNFQPVYNELKQLGMPIYGYLTPDGYKNTKDAWLNPEAMMQRISFASALTTGRLYLERQMVMDGDQFKFRNGDERHPVEPDQLSKTLGNAFSQDTLKKLKAAPKGIQSALILSSKEFMYR